MTWYVTIPETVRTLAFATREEAEAKARALLAGFATEDLADERTVIVARDTGPRQPAQESDPLAFIGRWKPGVGLVDVGGQPLD